MPLDTYIELDVLEERTILVLQSLWCVPVKIKFNFLEGTSFAGWLLVSV